MSTPTLSLTVIVVTLGRPNEVDRCLRQMREQDPPAQQIIVVDGDDAETARPVADRYLDVQYIRNPNGFGRMTASRNLGLQEAKGGIIAFIDDDAFARPGWVAAVLDTFRDADVGVVGGRVLNNQPDEATSGVDQIGRLLPNGTLTGFFAADPGRIIEVDHVMGCNMSFRREVLSKLGGFREDYPGISGVREDTDMCLRAKRLGYRLVFNPSAVVDHLGAPQVKGRRFDSRYAYYSARNHVVMLGRNYGLGSSKLGWYLLWSARQAMIELFRRIGGAVVRLGAVALGTSIGLISAIRLIVTRGYDPVRNDLVGRELSRHLWHRAEAVGTQQHEDIEVTSQNTCASP